MLAMAALLCASVTLQLFIPQLLRSFIDLAQSGAATADLRDIALLFLAAATGNQLFSAAATYTGANLGWRVTNRLRSNLTRHVFGLDMDFHSSRTNGELIERIDGDVTSLGHFFSMFSVRIFGGVLLLSGILVLLWTVQPWIGLGLTLFTLLELGVLVLTRKRAVPATTKEREASAALFGFIEERLAGREDLRANGAGGHALWRFNGVMRRFYHDGRRAWMTRATIWLTSYGLFIIGLGATIGAMIFFVQGGILTLGTGYMVFQYLMMLQGEIEQIAQHMQEVQKSIAGLSRMRELFEEQPKVVQHGNLSLDAGPLAVKVSDLSFHYPAAPGAAPRATLADISLELAPGRILGLLGRTGSGKTTLTRLLFRLFEPSSGSILLNGSNIRNIAPESLRGQIGLVTQDVQLFQASVRDNLTFFDDSVGDTKILQLLGMLGLDAWLANLPDGLDTVISAGGGSLSAGEAQLLALSRVFLKDPGLVVLDEPSSRLDPLTEQRLERAVDRLLQDRSAIIIAHRLATVERADDIMILDQGRILEYGPRLELAAEPSSRYAQLLRIADSGLDLEQLLENGAQYDAPVPASIPTPISTPLHTPVPAFREEVPA
jgi:ABC-type multidrug transport system fused ATPase/permease subunit